MIVNIPSPLRSYTQSQSQVEATGSSLKDLLDDLDRRYPGIRFRMIDEQDHIRKHIKLFVNRDPAEDLTVPLQQRDVVHIICALSGG